MRTSTTSTAPSACRAWAEARAGRGPGRRAVRLGAGADGRARGGLREPAAACRRRAAPGRFGFYEAIDYTPARAAARPVERRRPLVHGAPPGHEPARRWRTCCSIARCSGASSRIRCSGDPAAAAGAHSERRGAVLARRRAIGPSAESPARPEAPVRVHQQSRHADARSAAAVERPLPRHGHQRRRRLQPLEGPRRHALARGRHPRQLGHLLLPPRRRERRVLVDRAPADAAAPAHYEAIFSAGARRVPPPRPRASRPTPRSSSRRRTTSSCAGSRITNRSRARADDRGHELRRGGAGAAGRRRAASGLQQSLRADRDPPAAPGDSVHAPAPLAETTSALDVPPDGGARRRRRATPSYETDRARFIGRGRTVAAPAGHDGRRARCPDSEGSVLDPIVAIRAPDHARARRDGDDRHGHRHRRDARRRPIAPGREVPGPRTSPTASSTWPGRTARSCCASSTPPRPTRSSTRASPARSSTPMPSLRAEPSVLAAGTAAASRACGAMAISGDLPIVLLQIADPANIDLVRQLVQAHAYWRLKGLAVDLVIWNEDQSGYRQQLQDQIMGLIAAGVEAHVDRPAGRHLRAPRRADLRRGPRPAPVGRARDHQRPQGTLAEQVERRRPVAARGSPLRAPSTRIAAAAAPPTRPRPELILANGLGGFTARRPRVRHHAAPGAGDAGARGSTCSPTRISARSSRRAGGATPGARTPTSSA